MPFLKIINDVAICRFSGIWGTQLSCFVNWTEISLLVGFININIGLDKKIYKLEIEWSIAFTTHPFFKTTTGMHRLPFEGRHLLSKWLISFLEGQTYKIIIITVLIIIKTVMICSKLAIGCCFDGLQLMRPEHFFFMPLCYGGQTKTCTSSQCVLCIELLKLFVT